MVVEAVIQQIWPVKKTFGGSVRKAGWLRSFTSNIPLDKKWLLDVIVLEHAYQNRTGSLLEKELANSKQKGIHCETLPTKWQTQVPLAID
jgi:hypothetical protein